MRTRLKLILLPTLIFFSTCIFAQKYEMWGMTSEGGEFGAGTIYKTDSFGNNLTNVHSFEFNKGEEPYYSKICEATNGKFYGLTSDGGRRGDGVLFEYNDSTNEYKAIYEFTSYISGSLPLGGIIQASNGKLYGMTSEGKLNNSGVLFEYDLVAKSYQILFEFGTANGGRPNGTLLEASNGKLYGVVPFGGTFGVGILFEYNTLNNTFTTKVNFNRLTIGSNPQGSLIQATNGKLYGVTSFLSGSSRVGTLFEYDILLDTIIKKSEFSGLKGSNPLEGPIEASNGKFYGMTNTGGVNNFGVIYEYDLVTDTLIVKTHFDSLTSGKHPTGSLVEVSNGLFYGVARYGGINNDGVLFEYNNQNDSLLKKIDFEYTQNGYQPMGSLTLTSSNKLLGTTFLSDTGAGLLYSYDYIGNQLNNLKFLNHSAIGRHPEGSLTYANNGMLYGTSREGGANYWGSLFEVNPLTGEVKTKVNFDLVNTNGFPQDNLLYTKTNRMFGVATYGGTYRSSILYEYDFLLDTISIAHEFIYGTSSKSSLIEHSNGKIYGLSYQGSFSNSLVIFEFDYNSKIFRSLSPIPGSSSYGMIIEGPNGILYGVSTSGGVNNSGYLFSYDITTNAFNSLYDFNGVSGQAPFNELTLASNGKLYGMTLYGGSNGEGVLFEYDVTTSTYTKKLDFVDTISGGNPECQLRELNHGKLYGVVPYGGKNYGGVLFEYSFITDTLINKYEFSGGLNGAEPYGSLIKIPTCIMPKGTRTITACKSYVSPSGNHVWTSSGLYSDTLQISGCDSVISVDVTIKKVDVSISNLSGNTLVAGALNVSYQWLDCSNNYSIITNDTNRIFRPETSGIYAVEITSNGCVDTSACYPITVVGISENQLSNNLAVFPNPTNSNVTLSLGGLYSAFTTQVYNVHGMLINESTHQSATQVEVELGDSKGIYFIHLITSNGEKVVRKVVKN